MLDNVSFLRLAIVCYICTVLIFWSYGNSYIVYSTLSILLAVFAYSRYFSKYAKSNNFIIHIITFVLIFTLGLGIINGDLKSSIMVNISLLMPLSIATLDVNYRDFRMQVKKACIVNILICILLSSFVDFFNSNSLAFVIYCGISLGVLWLKTEETPRGRLWAIIYLIGGSLLLLQAGSRNAGMVIVVILLMTLTPNRFYKFGVLYRSIYILVLFLTITASDFMLSVLNDENAMQYIESFTKSFSEKKWGMDSHYILLMIVKSKFAELDIFSQLFGTGIKKFHTHNLFYQSLFFYGYIGTIIIYSFYIYIFERAYRLWVNNEDEISLGCYIIMIGHFMLQIGEVYMLGSESVVIMSFLPAALILQRWNEYRLNYHNEYTNNYALL